MNLGYRDPLTEPGVNPAYAAAVSDGLAGLNLGKFFQRAIVPALKVAAPIAAPFVPGNTIAGRLLSTFMPPVAPPLPPPTSPIQQAGPSPLLLAAGAAALLLLLKR